MTFPKVSDEELISRIQDACRKHPELANAQHSFHSTHELAGFCYIASETFKHFRQLSALVPKQLIHEGVSHWYLENEKTGRVIDITKDQFKTPVPYEDGKRRVFLTPLPSKRSQTLIRQIVKDWFVYAEEHKNGAA